ncbi:MAG: MFS transporter, partial [Rhodospirillaceae bacterium]|nr:MFS transporter [Rhodospirillaceae bacterium]
MTTTTSNGAGAGEDDAVPAQGESVDRQVIGLVGGAHFLSHYLIFLLPPILPLMKADFAVSYAALG